jgi:hypothetical protein
VERDQGLAVAVVSGLAMWLQLGEDVTM